MYKLSRVDSKCVFKNNIYVNHCDCNWFGYFNFKENTE